MTDNDHTRPSPSPSRRRFLRGLSVALTAGATAPALARQAAQQAPRSVNAETLAASQEVAGVQFSSSEREMLAGSVGANRDHVEAIRRLGISHDVEPAFAWRPPQPLPAGRRRATPNGPITPHGPARVEVSLPIEALAFAPVTTLAALIARREVTSVQLTRLYLDRLERYDQTLECVVTLTEDLAIALATRADKELSEGKHRGPLHGIPWGVKDLFDTTGIRTTWGAKPYETRVPNRDATAVSRLRDAGAVLIAKLSTGELAYGDLWFGGRTRNPWNPAKGSSGSSAGPAAAVAAGLVGFAVGTETGGSIISPASTCGVVGLRPTYGRVSRHGVMTLRWTMDKVGPMCRGVEDCALVLNAMYGPDGLDNTVVDLAFEWNPRKDLSSLRLGVVARDLESPPPGANDDEVNGWPERRVLLSAAVEEFRKAGARVDVIALPDFPAQSVYAMLNAEAGAMFDQLVRSGDVNQLAGQEPQQRANQLRTSRFISAVDYVQAQRARALLTREIETIFRTYDAFLAPTSSPSVTMTNLSGHPAITLPSGFAGTLPQAIMITGRLYDEATLLALAYAYESATTWHERHPSLAVGTEV